LIDYGGHLDATVSRLAADMITAVFIFGTPIILHVSGDTGYLAMPLLAGTAFTLAAICDIKESNTILLVENTHRS
jgi:hypothetical protein